MAILLLPPTTSLLMHRSSAGESLQTFWGKHFSLLPTAPSQATDRKPVQGMSRWVFAPLVRGKYQVHG
jgi:hypothetical protein